MESKYQSKYTDRKVRADQYLVEIFMARKYAAQKTPLPWRFWSDAKYKGEFMANLASSRALFKSYADRGISEETIVAALTREDAKKITWIKHEKVDVLIERQIEFEKSIKVADIDTSDCSMEKPKVKKKRKSTLSRLRELDDAGN